MLAFDEVILSRSLNSMSTEPEVEPVSTPETETKALPGVLSEIRWWVRDIFFAVGTAILIVVFLYQPVKVEGTSMLPELRDQERIFVNKFVYRIEEIARKDIVVFWYPMDPIEVLHQADHRHAGRYCGNSSTASVYVNEQASDEPYVDPRFIDHRSLSAGLCRARPLLRARRSSKSVQRQPHVGSGSRESTSTAKPSSVTGR